MQSKLNPYLNFNDQAKAAMEFYKNVFGGNLTMTTFQQGGMVQDPADAKRIMHAMLVAENAITLMASDIPAHMQAKDSIHVQAGPHAAISLSGDNEEELRGYWNKLSEGAKITQPLVPSPWGDIFGMLDDQFGISWLVNIASKKQQ